MSKSKLPKTFRGLAVARGKGINYEDMDELEHESALDEWPTKGAFYLVVNERPGNQSFGEIQAFKSKSEAVKYAKGLSNGNVDHIVLKCNSELLVIGTDNDL